MSLFLRSVAAILFLTASPLAATERQYKVESIRITGLRNAPQQVVLAEARLQPGGTYGERELTDAVRRVARLPFIVHAAHTIEQRGAGRYALTIAVSEARPLFVDAESYLLRDAAMTNDGEAREVVRSGLRRFAGSTELQASTDFHENYEAGATHYNLFGRGGFASLRLRWTEREPRVTYTDPSSGESLNVRTEIALSPQLRLAVPLFGNHSFVADAERNTQRSRWSSASFVSRDEWRATRANLAWLYETTNDELLPTRGSSWRTGIDVQEFSYRTAAQGEPLGGSTDARIDGYFSHVVHYFPVAAAKHTIIAGAGIGRSLFHFETGGGFPPSKGDMTGGFVEAGAASSLLPARWRRKLGELYVDARASRAVGPNANGYTVARAQIVHRSVWGTLRFSFQYSESAGMQPANSAASPLLGIEVESHGDERRID